MSNDTRITLLETTQALLVSMAQDPIAQTDSYCDVAIDIALARGPDPEEGNVASFVGSVEALLCEIDDRARSGTPEWQACSEALDRHLGRNA